jgi:hypothetical protein
MTSSPLSPVAWDAEPTDFPGHPVATIAFDRAAWTRIGARFAPFDHELGEVAYEATGSVDHGRVRFRVVDHSEDTTYLLADPRDEDGVQRVLAGLRAIGVQPEDVLERLPWVEPAVRRRATRPASAVRTN